MKRSQSKKRYEAKRPRQRYTFFYKESGDWTKFELTRSQGELWNAYCKMLNGAPTKANYQEFVNQNEIS